MKVSLASGKEKSMADWVKKKYIYIYIYIYIERIGVSNQKTSISAIVWKWSEETLLSKSLPALLENFRPFNFCRAYLVPPLLTEPILYFQLTRLYCVPTTCAGRHLNTRYQFFLHFRKQYIFGRYLAKF